jgi:hypothetical protein
VPGQSPSDSPRSGGLQRRQLDLVMSRIDVFDRTRAAPQDHPICTAVAPEGSFTVRTKVTSAAYGPALVFKFRRAHTQNSRVNRSQPRQNPKPEPTQGKRRGSTRRTASGVRLCLRRRRGAPPSAARPVPAHGVLTAAVGHWRGGGALVAATRTNVRAARQSRVS